MGKILDWIRLNALIVKAKAEGVFNWKIVQWTLTQDITFVFLFFSFYILNYSWNWKLLLACFGLWVVVKEIFKKLNALGYTLGGMKR